MTQMQITFGPFALSVNSCCYNFAPRKRNSKPTVRTESCGGMCVCE